MRVAAYVPLKLNNERLPNKNTKRFSNGRPLLSYVLAALQAARGIDRIVAYCSNAAIVEHLPQGVDFLRRDAGLDRNETRINEVMIAFARDVEADIYVLAHATAPFISTAHIEDGLARVRSGQFDSALTVVKLQEFLWRDGRPHNYDPATIPRTQDLPALYAETTGLYIYTRDLILHQNRRVGTRPHLIEVSKIEAIDINEPVDFQLADAVAAALDASCDRNAAALCTTTA